MNRPFDIYELWDTVWAHKLIVIVMTAIGAVSGVTYSLVVEEVYRAEVSVMPAGEKNITTGLRGLGGLAALAGVTIGSDNVEEPLAVLSSKQLTRGFIADQGLIDVFFPEGVDGAGKPVDIRDAVDFFDLYVRTVELDRKTGLVTVAIDWPDPEVAATWANGLIKRVNDQMRARALQESERNVEYLQREIADTKVVSLQQALGRVLESEMQNLMLARGNDEFAFKVIDEAVPPKKRHWPKRSLISVIATISGFLLALIFIFLRQIIAERPRRAPSIN